jgi:hypothetical protein
MRTTDSKLRETLEKAVVLYKFVSYCTINRHDILRRSTIKSLRKRHQAKFVYELVVGTNHVSEM